MIVIDTSALAEVLLVFTKADAVGRRLTERGQALHAPHLIDVEAVHVVRRYLRRGIIDEARAGLALQTLLALPITRHGHDSLLPRMWALRHNLTAYDSAFVALSESLNAPLLTCDRRLSAAPGHFATIELI